MNVEKINEILGVTESFKMPEKLLNILLSEHKNKILDKFMAENESLDHDWFTEYFQSEHGDRNKLKQDFTPGSVCKIATGINSLQEPVLDLCSGTGGLTIEAWLKGAKDFICVEYSERAIPILLFNLSVRNIKALVFRADALTREVFEIYKLNPTEKYGKIEKVENKELINFKCGSCITNPPYSLRWNGEREFKGYRSPPKSKADYGFLLDALERLEPGGEITAILSHGVLFRGATEKQIREQLIKDNLIDGIIGLPNKLFMNTGIPVCIIKLKKDRNENNVLFIDASKEFGKNRSNNILENEHIEKIIETYKNRKFVNKYADIATFKELEDNDFNMNIPRYVDTFEEEPLPETLEEAINKLLELDKKIYDSEKEILEISKQLIAKDSAVAKDLEELKKGLEEKVKLSEQRNGQLELCFPGISSKI